MRMMMARKGSEIEGESSLDATVDASRLASGGNKSIAELYQRVARGTELAEVSCQAAPEAEAEGERGGERVEEGGGRQQQQRQDTRQETSQHDDQAAAPPPPSRLAPLASLDCSITEHTITDGALAAATANCESPGGSSTNTVTGCHFDTPTMRGCFECDELSDMVNDSLFEITSSGCLSKSVFNTDLLLRRLEIESRPPQQQQQQQQHKEESGRQLDTGKGPDSSNRNGSKPRRSGSTRVEGPSSSANIQQATASKGRRKDASSSSIGGGSRQTGSILKATVAAAEPRKSSRRQTRSNPDVRQHLDDDGDDYDGQDNADQEGEGKGDSKGICGVCSKRIEPSKRRKGHRFTFSLFNLFSGSNKAPQSVDNDDKVNKDGDDDKLRCRCAQMIEQLTGDSSRVQSSLTTTTSNDDLTGRGGNNSDICSRPNNLTTVKNWRSGSETGTRIRMKSRDSVRLTNQRRQRNRRQQQHLQPRHRDDQNNHNNYTDRQILASRSKPFRNSSSSNDFQKATNHPKRQQGTELLLDFPVSRIQSGSIGAPLVEPVIGSGTSLQSAIRHRTLSDQTTDPSPSQLRSLKSVKFAQPDRIMNINEDTSRSCLYILKSAP